MAAAGKKQVKLYLTHDADALLKKAKALTGKSASVLVEELVTEVLAGEVEELEKG